MDGIEKLPSVTAEDGRQQLLEISHLKIVRKLAKIFEQNLENWRNSWRFKNSWYWNDEGNDTGSYQRIILTMLVKKIQCQGFWAAEQSVRNCNYFGWKAGFVCCSFVLKLAGSGNYTDVTYLDFFKAFDFLSITFWPRNMNYIKLMQHNTQ